MSELKEKLDVDQLVIRLREAASQPNADELVYAILKKTVQNPAAVAAGFAKSNEDDEILFEDESISIWHCRFRAGKQVPPHDHQMSATVAVYSGTEQNIFWKKDENDQINQYKVIPVGAGEVISIGSDEIHSVGCDTDADSFGIHVYLGKLTTVDRSLFDVENGESMPFDDQSYERLVANI